MKHKIIVFMGALLCTSVIEAKKAAVLTAVENKSDTPVSIYDRGSKQSHVIKPKTTEKINLDVRRELELTHLGTTQVIFASKKHVKIKDGEIKESTHAGNAARGAAGGVLGALGNRNATGGGVIVSAVLGGILGKALGYTKKNINVRTIHGVSAVASFSTPRTLQIDPAGAIAIA